MLIASLLLIIALCFGAGFFIYKNMLDKKMREEWFKGLHSTLLLVEIPRTNDKKELSAEQMFASLHGILRGRKDLKEFKEYQEHIGFEIISIGRKIQFYVWTPTALKAFVEGQIYAQYSDAQIKETDPEHDYSHAIPADHFVKVTEVGLVDDQTLPIKTFPTFEVDPLAAITATLAKLDSNDEVLGMQILARPIDDNWHKTAQQKIKSIEGGKKGVFSLKALTKFSKTLWQPPEESSESKSDISDRDRTRIKLIEEKSQKLGYQVKVRLLYACPRSMQSTSRLKFQALLGALKQFNTTNLNGFKQLSSNIATFDQFKERDFSDKGFILNIEELASLYHLPHSNVETPNIVWARSRTGEPPSNLTIYKEGDHSISPIGKTTFRGEHQIFGLSREDRGRHAYIIGQTGVGKSGLLELLLAADVNSNHGFALIDPHGDLAASTLMRIAPERAKDVVYFNPADVDFPIGFNPLEFHDESQKSMVASEIVGSLKKMFESWGPRLEYILRYTILSLLEYPDSTMLDITRLLTDAKFQKKVVACVTDPVVRNFWTKEYASWNEKYRTEAVAPVLNKVGAFTANPIIRNIVGQSKSGFNIRQIMDESKILVINLSRGLIGEDNAAILGSLLVTKVQLAAMSRADIPDINDRRQFYLYVDEFQNFATDSFATILSEARKYGLNLTVANQYISQMPPEVKDAVFGNVGSIISFRVSPDDASSLQQYFEPQFEAADLIQLHNRDFLANITLHSEKTVPFSAVTLDLPAHIGNVLDLITESNRRTIAARREDIEDAILVANGDAPKNRSSEQKTQVPLPEKVALQQPVEIMRPQSSTKPRNRDAIPALLAKTVLKKPEQTKTRKTLVQSGEQNKAQDDSAPKKKRRRRKRGKKKPGQPKVDEGNVQIAGVVPKEPIRQPSPRQTEQSSPKTQPVVNTSDEAVLHIRR